MSSYCQFRPDENGHDLRLFLVTTDILHVKNAKRLNFHKESQSHSPSQMNGGEISLSKARRRFGLVIKWSISKKREIWCMILNITTQKSGTVVVTILVDTYGNVTKAQPGAEGTTVDNSEL